MEDLEDSEVDTEGLAVLDIDGSLEVNIEGSLEQDIEEEDLIVCSGRWVVV